MPRLSWGLSSLRTVPLRSVDALNTATARTGDSRIWRPSSPPASEPKVARYQSHDRAAAFASAVGVVDRAVSVAQVHEQSDRGARDHGDIHARRSTLAEPSHADLRQPARLPGHGDLYRRPVRW